MKKIVFYTLFILIGSSYTVAQTHNFDKRGSLNFATRSDIIALTMKSRYSVTQALHLVPSVSYYLAMDELSILASNANVIYLVPILRRGKLYPIVGGGYVRWRKQNKQRLMDSAKRNNEPSAQETKLVEASRYFKQYHKKITGNIGVGYQHYFGDRFYSNTELKYEVMSQYSQFIPTLGIGYTIFK